MLNCRSPMESVIASRPRAPRLSRPSTTLVRAGLMFCTTLTSSGMRAISSRAISLPWGKRGPLVTSTAIASPVPRPTRTSTWRSTPVWLRSS